MRIALAQINPIVGDIAGNAKLIRNAIDLARQQHARLIVFPELAIIGYPPRDLLLKPAVINQCVAMIEQLAAYCTDIAAIIGYPCPAEGEVGRALYNAAALCDGGEIVHRYVKSLLPTYDVFDERRYFEPGPGNPSAEDENETLPEIDGVKIGVSICEDLWNDADFLGRKLYHQDPVQQLVDCGADVIINASASPFVVGKHDLRISLFSKIAKEAGRPVLYCNQVGGNDELIFDGRSCAFDAEGNVIAHGKSFEDDLVLVDIAGAGDDKGKSSKSIAAAKPCDVICDAYHALVLGLRDYCRKCGFKTIVLGLSGGIDSALTCAIAVAALGAENVRGVAMPSRYSSDDSVNDAVDLARRLDIKLHTIAIKDAHDAFEGMLTPHFEGREPDTTEENIQARVRGVILMAMSNKFGSLLVTTGNKSELAVGYCTLYGDMAGGLAVLSDVPKTMVWELSRWINEGDGSPLRQEFDGPVIPENSITKPPSAELKPDQVDQDSLPEYEILDQIIERYVEQEQSAKRIIDETGFEGETVMRIVRLIDLNEYKRKQAAPGLKITGREFGIGRRMPIAQRYDNRGE